jgi:thioredoxin reductase (NADPH)
VTVADDTTRRPVLLVISDNASLRADFEEALERRFDRDYRIESVATPAALDAILARLDREPAEIALVAADAHFGAVDGLDAINHVYERHPEARRAIVTGINDRTAAAIVLRATTLGQIDFTLAWPWRSPEEWLYPQIQEALSRWWQDNRPRFELVRVIGERWDSRSHELRDLLDRNALPFRVLRRGRT